MTCSYRCLAPFMQPCANVQADQYRVNNFQPVQVSTAAQNGPQGHDAAELTISQFHGLGFVENGNEVQGRFEKIDRVQE
jgi:hypothetical protein